MPEQWFGLLVVGLIAGVASGMFGIGGGLVIVPALILLLGFTQLAANGTSLAALLLPVSIFAVIAYYRAGKLKLPVAALLAVGLFVGGYFGGSLANDLPQNTLKQLYGLFLLLMAWRFAEPRKWLAERRGAKIDHPPEDSSADATWYVLLGVGLLAGVLAGMFGIGGGAIIVPALVTLFHYDQKRAVGTSLAALLLPNIPAIVPYYNSGNLDLSIALFVGLGLVAGAFAGAKIALGLSSVTIKRLYGLFLLVVALRFIFGG